MEKSTFWMAAVVGATLLLAPPATRAAAVINSEAITNYSGFLLQNNGTLESVPVQAGYFINNLTTHLVTQTWRIGFQLVDSSGNAASAEVFSQSFTTSIASRGSTSGSQTAVLPPLSITSGLPYRLAVQLYGQNTAIPPAWVALPGGPALSDEYRFEVVPSGTAAGVVGWLNSATVSQPFAVVTVPGKQNFQVEAKGVLGRMEQLAQPATTDAYQLLFDVTLTGNQSGTVALVNPHTVVTVALATHALDGGPSASAFDQLVDFQPVGQLDSTDSYTVSVSFSYAGPNTAAAAAQTTTLTGQQLFHFNGHLFFGSVGTTITDITDPPQSIGIVPGTGANLTVGASGALLANPGFTFSTTADVTALLKPDGTVVTSDSVDLAAPSTPDTGIVNGVNFRRDTITLDGTGAHASVRVGFPSGFGVSAAANVRRLQASYPAGTMALDAALNPVGVVTLSPTQLDATSFYAVHEDLPELFKASGITWDTSAGTFTILRTDTLYVRGAELDALDALPSTDQTVLAKDRPSNDGYLQRPASDAGLNVVVQADAAGRAVLATAQIDLPPGSFVTHFPENTTVTWNQAGVLAIRNGQVDLASSSLPGASDATFPVSPSAPTDPPPASSATLNFSPNGSSWTFTPDGGLRAAGTIAPASLRWGPRDPTTFAQVTSAFTAAAALIPGPVLRGTLAVSSNDNRPGELLLEGFAKPDDASYVEKPGTVAYTSGLADYAGLNFRVGTDGSQNATSLIGNAAVGPYALAGISKYYARAAGVSGLHAAVASSFSQLASALVVYGFPLSLSAYQISFLDNVVQDSRVAGTVNVPGARGTPGFAQPFTQLKFDAQGHPTELTLPSQPNLLQTLTYWNAQFHPLAAEFLAKPSDPNTYALIFGAELLLPNVVKDPIRGGLGFYPDGHLVAASDGFPGVNSRLRPPKLISLHGTGSVLDSTRPGFSAHPVTDVYLNDPNAAGAPDAGFAAFAGTVQVSFFQDLQVHVLARGAGGHTSVRAGWSEGTKTFFNTAQFDASNRGFPLGSTSADYENDAEPAGFVYFDPNDPTHQARNPYNPLARQTWLGFVDFNLPVTWDPAQRRFVSSVPEQQNFLVLNSQRVIQQLTPSGAEIRFGLQFNGLPRLNLAALIIDDKEATQQLIKFIPNGPQLISGLNAFDKLLNNQSDELISQGLDFVLDQFLDDLFAQGGPLSNAISAADAVQAIGTAGTAQFGQLSGTLMNRLKGVIGTINDANSVMKTISDSLQDIDGGLSTADTLLIKDNQGKRGTMLLQTINLAKSVGLPDQDVDPVTQSIDNLINIELAPTLDDVQHALDEAHSLSSSAKGIVGDVQGLTQSALDAVNTAGALPDQVLLAMKDYFNAANDPTGRLLVELDPQKLRADLKRVAHDTILQSGFVTSLQSTVRDVVEPIHEQYGAVFDQIFGVINDIVKSSLQELSDQVIDHLNDDLGKINRAIGGFSDTLRLTQVEGSARIVGDVLDRAHINGTLALHVPSPITLLGSVDFTRFRGDQPAPGCASATPDGRAQITLKAEGNASIAGGPAVHALAQGQYSMAQNGTPLAIAGNLSVDGDVHLDVVALKHAEFDFAFGNSDNYVRAQGAGSIWLFNADVRCFMGRTCDPTIFTWLDPELTGLLTALKLTPPDKGHAVTGLYFRGDGDVVLNRIVDIPDALVTLKAKGGQGSFVFGDDALANIIPGLRWRFGITVGLGPVSADAELNAAGGLNPIALLKTDGIPDLVASLFTNPGLIQGAVHGTFTPTFTAGPVSWSKDFNFTALGFFTPPPVAPPPGFFFVNKVEF